MGRTATGLRVLSAPRPSSEERVLEPSPVAEGVTKSLSGEDVEHIVDVFRILLRWDEERRS